MQREGFLVFFFPSKKWVQNNDMTTVDAGKDVKKLDHSYVADGNVKWYNHSGKQFGSFLHFVIQQKLTHHCKAIILQ